LSSTRIDRYEERKKLLQRRREEEGAAEAAAEEESPPLLSFLSKKTAHGKRRRTWENAEIQTSDNEDGMQVREKLEQGKKKKIAQEHDEEEHERASSSRASADGKKCERFRGRFVEPRGVGFTGRTGIGRGNERTSGQPKVPNLGARHLRTSNNT
jgi:hypothetical protein